MTCQRRGEILGLCPTPRGSAPVETPTLAPPQSRRGIPAPLLNLGNDGSHANPERTLAARFRRGAGICPDLRHVVSKCVHSYCESSISEPLQMTVHFEFGVKIFGFWDLSKSQLRICRIRGFLKPFTALHARLTFGSRLRPFPDA